MPTIGELREAVCDSCQPATVPAVRDGVEFGWAYFAAAKALDAFHLVGFPDIVFRDGIHLAFGGALAAVGTRFVYQPFIEAKLG